MSPRCSRVRVRVTPRLWLCTLTLFTAYAVVAVETVSVAGRALVLDTTVLFIDDQRIQIDGIAGPKDTDVCMGAAGAWACGLEAKQALAKWLGDETVSCDRLQRYANGTLTATCKLGGEDVAGWLVSNGWALSTGGVERSYAKQEKQARAAEVGVWRDGFVPPNFWRIPGEELGCDVCAARKQRLKKKGATQ